MGIPPFSIIRYQNNPNFSQIGQQLMIIPVPGFSASSYALSGPALPSGVSFSTVTGYFTGSPTALMAATTYTVTATLANSNTTQCEVILAVVDIPQEASLVNEASATGLTNLKLIAETNFLNSVETMVNNANSLGQFWVNVELGQYVSFLFVYNYFTALNFTVIDLNPSNQSGQFASFFGEYPSFPGAIGGTWLGPWGPNYNDYTQPYPTAVVSTPPRKARILWTPYNGYIPFPYNPY